MVKRAVKAIVRNIFGYILLAIGLFLSVPLVLGPGFVFVLAGLALADWPGRKRFFRWLHTFHWFEACAEWIHEHFRFRLPGHRGKNFQPSKTKTGDRCCEDSDEDASTRDHVGKKAG